MAAGMSVRYDAEFVEWKGLQKGYKEVWEQVARAIYAVIAIEGGATVEDIPGTIEPGEDDKDDEDDGNP
jgi:hypothetical protein